LLAAECKSPYTLEADAAANAKLAKLGIAEIEGVGLHGLRRTYASLRAAAGEDPTYVSEQLGDEDPRFTFGSTRTQRSCGHCGHELFVRLLLGTRVEVVRSKSPSGVVPNV
jgi:hypothetical protein